MIAVDTNLLIYAHRAGVPQHQAARRAIQRASRHPDGWGIAAPCVAEFWSVVTHPAGVGGASTAQQAHGFLRALIVEAGAKVWLPQHGFWERLAQAAGDLRLQGPRIFDLQIGLIAFGDGATEVWTHDPDFAALPGLRLHDPL